jgi:predicted MFS family arabinose efflux permease
VARHWIILGVLTLARTAMGFQFQSIPAAAPQLTGEVGLSYALLGTLIGLYLLPGAAVALPGGWLGTRFGDKRVALFGLALMTAGGVVTGLSAAGWAIFAGRLVSGIGGVLLNVLLTKMVADWFAGRDTVTAMGILIVSWPLGIALALVALPGVVEALGWQWAMFAAAAATGLALALVAAVYGPPPADEPGDRPHARAATAERPAARLSRRELLLATLAGQVWAFYNVALITVLAFGPDFLVATGESPVAAAATVSLVSWLIMPGLVLGGLIAHRVGNADLTMAAGFLAVAALVWAVPLTGGPLLLFALIGLLFGPPGPLIMVLPVEAVAAPKRGIGMGVYFTCYYLGMALIAPLAGLSRDLTGDPAAPVLLGGAMMLAALAFLLVFRAAQRRAAPVAG